MKCFTTVLSTLVLCLSAQASELPLKGTYSYRYLGFIPIFEARLHIPDDYANPAFDPEKPLKLVFNYQQKISKDQLIAQADKSLKSLEKKGLKERFTTQLAKLNAAYRDVTPGDEYQLNYSPATGTKLFLNEQELVTIDGNEFPSFYFSIWLGYKAPSSKMSRSLWADLAKNE